MHSVQPLISALKVAQKKIILLAVEVMKDSALR